MVTSSDQTVTLYQPVGPEELALVEASSFRAFPARLPAGSALTASPTSTPSQATNCGRRSRGP